MSGSPSPFIAAHQFPSLAPPGWLLVDCLLRQLAQPRDNRAISMNAVRRELGARWFIHKRHKFVRESRHRAANTDTAHIRTTTNSCHPPSLGHVALHHRPPASQLYKAFGGAVLGSEIAYFIVTCPITSLVHRIAKEPGRSVGVIQRNHGGQTCNLVEEIENSLHEVVWLHRAPWHADDWNTRIGFPVPAKIVKESHSTGRVA